MATYTAMKEMVTLVINAFFEIPALAKFVLPFVLIPLIFWILGTIWNYAWGDKGISDDDWQNPVRRQ